MAADCLPGEALNSAHAHCISVWSSHLSPGLLEPVGGGCAIAGVVLAVDGAHLGAVVSVASHSSVLASVHLSATAAPFVVCFRDRAGITPPTHRMR